MKTTLSLLMALLISALTYAQTPVSFQPKWKVGDKRKATIVETGTGYKNGEITEQTTETIDVLYEVMKETVTDYTVKITIENIALKSVEKFYDKIGEDLKAYKDLNLLYRVNKMGGTADLLNWKEAKAFIEESFEQVTKVVKKKSPDSEMMVGFVMKSVVTMFDSKEAVEGYLEGEVNMLIMPFGKAFPLNDTLKVDDYQANPFNPGEEVRAVQQYVLTDQGKGLYNINHTMDIDLSGFVAMMKEMMAGFGKSLGVSDSSVANKTAELDELEFNMDYHTNWVFNSNTSWPESFKMVTDFYGSDPSGARRNLTERVVTFK